MQTGETSAAANSSRTIRLKETHHRSGRGVALRAVAALAIASCCARANADTIVFVASTANSPPLNIFTQGQLTGGIVKDVGDAIAARMGRNPSYMTLPRNRIGTALAAASADAICYAQPEWYSVPLNWSHSFIPNTGTIVIGAHAAPLTTLADLRGQVLGTVFGFFYPQIDAVIGQDYKRDEAPSEILNLEKIRGGRVPYAVADEMVLDWEARQHPELHSLKTLPLPEIKAGCALSPKSRVPLADFSQTIDHLIDDGTMERIFSRYR